MLKTISVSIPGAVWQSEPIGSDPHYTPDTEELRRIRSFAKVVRRGRGTTVILTGTPSDLACYARSLETTAYLNLEACDEFQRPLGRKCAAAAKKIFEAVQAEQP